MYNLYTHKIKGRASANIKTFKLEELVNRQVSDTQMRYDINTLFSYLMVYY